MNKKLIFLSLFCFISAFTLTAQSAEKIEQIVGADSITWGQASYLFASYLDSETDDVSKSLDLLKEQGLVPSKKEISADSKITIEEYSFVIAKVFNIKTSLWYTITNSPYYAFKMLKNMYILDSKEVSQNPVSGRQAIRLIQAASKLQEQNTANDSASGDLQ